MGTDDAACVRLWRFWWVTTLYFVDGCPSGGIILTLARLCFFDLCLTLSCGSMAALGVSSGSSANWRSSSLLSSRIAAILTSIRCSWSAAFFASTPVWRA